MFDSPLENMLCIVMSKLAFSASAFERLSGSNNSVSSTLLAVYSHAPFTMLISIFHAMILLV